MSGDKPTFGFWITVVATSALLLYVLSFGPVCWIVAESVERTEVGMRLASIVYYPIVWLGYVAGGPVNHSIVWYAKIGTRDGICPMMIDGEIGWVYPLF
jgi:hypothetical protein